MRTSCFLSIVLASLPILGTCLATSAANAYAFDNDSSRHYQNDSRQDGARHHRHKKRHHRHRSDVDESNTPNVRGNFTTPSPTTPITPTITPTTPIQTTPTTPIAPQPVLPANTSGRYIPAPGTTWHWQLQGMNTNVDATVFDFDLFALAESPQIIQALHSANPKRYVICYFSAGTSEDWRPDIKEFFASDMKNSVEGGPGGQPWEGERWLDVHSLNVRFIMTKRLDLAQKIGCDGVEPDNVDGFDNPNTGLSYGAQDQLDYNKFLAEEAHKRNLSIGLKNDLKQIPALVNFFDFAVNEQCNEYQECNELLPFIRQGKAVFNAEYASKYVNNPLPVCEYAKANQFSSLILDIELTDKTRIACK